MAYHWLSGVLLVWEDAADWSRFSNRFTEKVDYLA